MDLFCMKPQNSTFMLSESPSRNAFLNDNRTPQITENNNQISPNGSDKKLQEVWSIHNFQTNKVKVEQTHNNFNNVVKMSWANETADLKIKLPEKSDEEIEDDKMEAETSSVVSSPEKIDNTSPSHHARRPMNAFLIFCKKHRPIVRQKYQNLENRGVTRILGEWWALLDDTERQPYTDLAKEYKDAFFSANPDFKWYKLPAPPLRTLATRPPTVHKVSTPLSSPSNNFLMIPEFTPGKLADESQLGGLTSLMNNNFSTKPKTSDCCKQAEYSTQQENNNNNNNNNHNSSIAIESNYDSQLSPVNLVKTTSLPQALPKPIKKRIFEQYDVDNKTVTRNSPLDVSLEEETQEVDEMRQMNSNMTNQDLMNKVVDEMFAKHMEDDLDKNGLNDYKERKSDRLCKGKRYEKFMYEGKLLGNKRDTKLTQQKYCKIDSKIETELNNKLDTQTPKLDLGNTIKRLAERTNIKLDFDKQKDDETTETKSIERVRTISENSDSSTKTTSPTSSFNLDLRITNLPSLSYDMFLQRKKESKKRKIRTKTDSESKHKLQKLDKSDKQLVGSKKRKNKQSITHLGKKADTDLNNDLLGLATLAEVAANTEKINEKISD